MGKIMASIKIVEVEYHRSGISREKPLLLFASISLQFQFERIHEHIVNLLANKYKYALS